MNAIMIDPIEIRTQFIPSIDWQKNEAFEDNDLTDAVHIWKIKVPEHFCSLFKEHRHILNDREYEKAKRYHWEDDFRSYLTGRIVLRILLSKYLSLTAANIEFGTFGKKPIMLNDQRIKFNLSYSGEYILISLAQEETGIDIEKINPKFDYQSLLETCFSEEESSSITEDLPKSRNNFFLHWTRKEALLKYTGQGIVDNLANVPSLNGRQSLFDSDLNILENIQVDSFKISPDCVGTIVYPGTLRTVKYFIW